MTQRSDVVRIAGGVLACVAVLAFATSRAETPTPAAWNAEGASRLPLAHPQRFGAVCDGIADDSAAFQQAINYALLNGLELTWPAPSVPGGCRITTGLVVAPPSGQAFGTFHIHAAPLLGANVHLDCQVADGAACLRIANAKQSRIDGLVVKIGAGTGKRAIHVGDPNAAQSTSQLVLRDVKIQMAGTGHIGVLLGGTSSGNQDVASVFLENLYCDGTVTTQGHTCVAWGGANVTDNKIANSSFSNLKYFVTNNRNISGPGGGGSMAVVNTGGSAVEKLLYYEASLGEFTWIGGPRIEHAQALLWGDGGAGDTGSTILFQGLHCAQCDDDGDGILFKTTGCQALVLDGLRIGLTNAGTRLGAAAITGDCATGAIASVTLRGGEWAVSTDPWTLAGGGAYVVTVAGVKQMSASETSTGMLTSRLPEGLATDAPSTCAADRNGERYYDLSLRETCVCNSAHTLGARWCQVDGGGCTSNASCG